MFPISSNAKDCSGEKLNIEAIKCLQAEIESIKNDRIKIPKGAVVAFELVNCPNGWEKYKEAESRFIVGSGNGRGLSRKSIGEIGGVENVKLSVQQMPKHQHNTPQAMDNTGPNFGLGPKRNSVHGVSWHVNSTEMTSWEGKGQPVGIIPPYLALNYCIKK